MSEQSFSAAKILQTFYYYLRGSLWWTAERLLVKKFRRYHGSDRKGHPVLSLRETPLEDSGGMIPMLFGCSGNRGPIVVKGLTKDRGQDYTSVFGTIIEPGWFEAEDFTRYHEEQLQKGCGSLDDIKDMWPNFDKPMVSDDEMLQVESFMSRNAERVRKRGSIS